MTRTVDRVQVMRVCVWFWRARVRFWWMCARFDVWLAVHRFARSVCRLVRRVGGVR